MATRSMAHASSTLATMFWIWNRLILTARRRNLASMWQYRRLASSASASLRLPVTTRLPDEKMRQVLRGVLSRRLAAANFLLLNSQNGILRTSSLRSMGIPSMENVQTQLTSSTGGRRLAILRAEVKVVEASFAELEHEFSVGRGLGAGEGGHVSCFVGWPQLQARRQVLGHVPRRPSAGQEPLDGFLHERLVAVDGPIHAPLHVGRGGVLRGGDCLQRSVQLAGLLRVERGGRARARVPRG